VLRNKQLVYTFWVFSIEFQEFAFYQHVHCSLSVRCIIVSGVLLHLISHWFIFLSYDGFTILPEISMFSHHGHTTEQQTLIRCFLPFVRGHTSVCLVHFYGHSILLSEALCGCYLTAWTTQRALIINLEQFFRFALNGYLRLESLASGASFGGTKQAFIVLQRVISIFDRSHLEIENVSCIYVMGLII
jgi:hypothetical protein